MATQSGAGLDLSFKAAADLSSKQYLFVKIAGTSGTDVTINVPSAATDRCVGVLMTKPGSANAADVRIIGIAPVISDGSGTSISAGDYVGPNSGGTAVKKATADYNVGGIAMAASSTSGAVIPVLLTLGAWFRSAAG